MVNLSYFHLSEDILSVLCVMTSINVMFSVLYTVINLGVIKWELRGVEGHSEI